MKNFALFTMIVGLLVGCSDGTPVRVAADIDVPGLMEQLKSSDPDVRYKACVALSTGLENAAPALDVLTEMLKSDREARVREMAGYAIYEMGDEIGKAAMPVVKERFKTERSPGVRSVLNNLWNRLEPETSPAAKMNQP